MIYLLFLIFFKPDVRTSGKIFCNYCECWLKNIFSRIYLAKIITNTTKNHKTSARRRIEVWRVKLEFLCKAHSKQNLKYHDALNNFVRCRYAGVKVCIGFLFTNISFSFVEFSAMSVSIPEKRWRRGHLASDFWLNLSVTWRNTASNKKRIKKITKHANPYPTAYGLKSVG